MTIRPEHVLTDGQDTAQPRVSAPPVAAVGVLDVFRARSDEVAEVFAATVV